MAWRRRAVTLLAIISLLLVPSTGAVLWPVDSITPLPDGSIPTAKDTPERYSVFDEAITDYMEEHGVTAASLAVAVDGEEVYRQGYGWMRPSTDDASPVVAPDALFRIASITKPHTEVVVRDLAQRGELSLADPVFCLEGSPSECHLEISPYNGELGDEHLEEITIQHLLDHQGGWDRYASGHIMFESEEVADALGVPSPPTTRQIATYQLAQSLDFAPGTDRAYSNFGYALLALIIEKVTGEPFTDQVKQIAYGVPADEVGTASEDGTDIEAARTLTQHRNEREPTYHCPGITDHVFDPLEDWDAPACWPDGGWAIEPMVGAGNLIASAPQILEFTSDYWLWGEERTGTCDGCWAYFFGSLSGTLTLTQQRTDGLDFVILTNKRWDPDHGLLYGAIQDTVNDAADDYMAEHHGTGQASSTGEALVPVTQAQDRELLGEPLGGRSFDIVASYQPTHAGSPDVLAG